MVSKKQLNLAAKKIEEAMVLLAEAKKIADEQTTAPEVVGWIQDVMGMVSRDLAEAKNNAGSAWADLKDIIEVF